MLRFVVVALMLGILMHSDHANLANGLEGTWRPLFDGNTSMPAGTEAPFVRFDWDGTWSSSDGCNRPVGTFVMSAGGALFRAKAVGFQTLMGCANVPNVAVLTAADSVEIAPDQLIFRDDDGVEIGSYRRVASA